MSNAVNLVRSILIIHRECRAPRCLDHISVVALLPTAQPFHPTHSMAAFTGRRHISSRAESSGRTAPRSPTGESDPGR